MTRRPRRFTGATMLLEAALLALSFQCVAMAEVCDLACQKAQRAALLSLYASLDGPSWINRTGWDTAAEVSEDSEQQPPHCSWRGVACCNNRYLADLQVPDSPTVFLTCPVPKSVVGLFMVNNFLRGTLPDERSLWSTLASLLHIQLSGNFIAGTLPESLPECIPRILLLDGNNLRGTIPATYTACKSLWRMSLRHNLLSGTIPSWANATTMTTLDLALNALTGSIPDDWLVTETLNVLSIESNFISGQIPDPWLPESPTPIGQPLQLSFAHNQLTGTVPLGLTTLPITDLDISQNRLSGGLDFFRGMNGLLTFRASDNNFSGPFMLPRGPDALLQVLEVDSNRLTGTIPTASLASFSHMDVRNNSLSGPIPSDWQLPALELLLLTGNNISHKGTALNARDEALPTGMFFDRTSYTRASDVMFLYCPIVVPEISTYPAMNAIDVDSYYFSYQYCICQSKYRREMVGDRLQCAPYQTQNWLLIGSVTAAGVVTACSLIIAAVLIWWHRHLMRLSHLHKKRGPPGQGQPLTLVATDVEASTSLWEWNRAAMMEAISIHDTILRSRLHDFHGYEVATEGDAFVMAFHEPRDAVSWAIVTQQELLAAKWPQALERHSRTSIKLSADTGRQHPDRDFLTLSQVNTRAVIFRGLRVRMAVASGFASEVKTNDNSHRREYRGAVYDRVMTIQNVIHGGQIMTDTEAFHGINSCLAEIATDVPSHPDFEQVTGVPSALLPASNFSGAAGRRSKGPGLLHMLHGKSTLGLTGRQDSIDLNPSGHGAHLGSELPPAQMSGLPSPGSAQHPGSSFGLLMVINMGTHLLKDADGPQLLVQVAIPGLEDRARRLPSLTSIAISPGYFHAPGAMLSPLGRLVTQSSTPTADSQPLPPVSMLFCAIDGYELMQAANFDAAQAALVSFRNIVRLWLNALDGYECQEANGDFMIAFHSASQAAHFCLQVQEEMMKAAYDDDVLCLPGCGVTVDGHEGFIWRGPRVRMGICQDLPQAIMPHSTSGRADYFGGLVNRAARFCHSAAHGGQIIMPLSLAESLASEWCGVKVGFPSATTAGMSFPAGIPTDGISTPMQAAPPALAAIKHVQSEAARPVGVVQHVQRSLSQKVNPLMTLAGLPKAASETTRADSMELMPLKAAQLQPEVSSISSSMSGTGSLEPLLQTSRKLSIATRLPRPQPLHLQGHLPSVAKAKAWPRAGTPRQSMHEVQSLSARSRPNSACDAEHGRGSTDGFPSQRLERIISRAESSHWDVDHGAVRRVPLTGGIGEQIEFHHRGVCAFKGVPELQPIIEMTSAHLTSRKFPEGLPSKKGKLVSPAQGLQCLLTLT